MHRLLHLRGAEDAVGGLTVRARRDVGQPDEPEFGQLSSRAQAPAEQVREVLPAPGDVLRAAGAPHRQRARSVSMRVGSIALCAVAAIVPAALFIGMQGTGVIDQLARLPVPVVVWPLLALLLTLGFGVSVGLFAARTVAAPLDALVRTVKDIGVESRPAAASSSWIREVAALAGALVDLRARVAVLVESARVSSDRDLGLNGAGGRQHDIVARGSNDGLWDWDLASDTLYCSPRWYALLGVQDGDDLVSPSVWLDRVHPDDLPELRARIDAHLRGQIDHLACESRLLGDDGVYRWTLARGLALRREDGTPYRIAGSLADVSERHEAEEGQRLDALHDALTGLPNRGHAVQRLELAIGRSRRTGAPRVAVLLLDVDRFKAVNDSLGHAVGDDLLVAISRRLEGCVRDGDTVARLGGDEWAIVMEDVAGTEQAVLVAERIRMALRQPLQVGVHSLFVTASIGIALLEDTGYAPDDLLRDAETATYRAKELGRDRHVIFDRSLRMRAAAQLTLESDLRHALDRGELLVFYQPIVAADDLRVRGAEALLRWQHPERGLVPPADFIGFAEESGTIVPLGEWVILQAIEQMREWQAAGLAPERVSVNLSARQLHQDGLPERIASALDRAGLAPACLELELTEGVMAEQVESTVQVLQRLRDLGIQLAVDDFGTGYSSLAYLTRFPVSTVKIDRAFLTDIQHDTINQAIVQAVTTLAHSIGMRVVAEGIETAEQRELAQALGCDEVQGFLVSKPLPADRATVWLGVQRGLEPQRHGGRKTPAG